MDISIREKGDGGEMTLKGNDLEMFEGYENMPYLSTFCGEDWWGDDVPAEGEDIKFNAETERILNTTPLTSNGRLIIEQAILRDLKHLKKHIPGTEIVVRVVITSDDRLDIFINMDGKEFYMQWNPDYVAPEVIPEPTPPAPVTALYHWRSEGIVRTTPDTIVLLHWEESAFGGTTYRLDHFEAPAPDLYVLMAELNGYDVLMFNGTVSENVYSRNPIDLTHTDKATLVMVMKKGSLPAATRRIASLAEVGTTFDSLDDTFGVAFSGPAVLNQVRYTNPQAKTTITTGSTDWAVWEFAFDRAGVNRTYINGVEVSGANVGSGTTPTNFGAHYFFLGSAWPFSPVAAQIAEVMIFDTLFDATMRAEVTSELQTKFGL